MSNSFYKPKPIEKYKTAKLTHANKSANLDRQLFYNTQLTLAGYYKLDACRFG